MREIIPAFTLPIAALAACLFASGAAIAQSAPKALEIEKVDLCPEGNPCGTARLKGLDVTFDFEDHGGNNIGYSWQCEGLKYPEQPWPDDCSVSLRGTEIDKRFGPDAELNFEGPKKYRVVISERPDFGIEVATALILPGRGCIDGGKCVATFQGFGKIIFDFNDQSGNTFGYTWECEKGLDYPAKPWPEGCKISPRPSWRRYDESFQVKKIEECSPKCVVKER